MVKILTLFAFYSPASDNDPPGDQIAPAERRVLVWDLGP